MMVQAGKKELKEHVDQSGRQLIQQTEETSMKRLIGLLIRRQSDALDLLDCVEAKAETGLEAPGRKPFGQRLLSSAPQPAVSLLLSVAALNFTAMTASIGEHRRISLVDDLPGAAGHSADSVGSSPGYRSPAPAGAAEAMGGSDAGSGQGESQNGSSAEAGGD